MRGCLHSPTSEQPNSQQTRNCQEVIGRKATEFEAGETEAQPSDDALVLGPESAGAEAVHSWGCRC